ncbi:MAG: TolC family protein [Gemmatimonadaceae bacterium]
MKRARQIAAVLLCAGCAGTPSVAGVAGTAPAPNREWTPPAAPRDALPAALASFPPDLLARANTLTMGDVVDLALRNNPETQLSWANARAAAAAYGGSKALYYPTIDGEIGVTHLRSSPTFSNDSVLRPSLTQTNYGPTLSVSWLIADLGGRAGTIESARQALIAANWTHNASLQNVVLEVESAYFNYMANKGLVESERLSVKEAETSLESTQQRQHVGLATIADVLQAKTALSQAKLTLETTEGDLQTTRGALAAAMGLPANAPYDIEAAPATNVGPATDSVDALIAQAVERRPDLASAQAEYRQAIGNVRAARGHLFPSIRATGAGGRTYVQTLPGGASNYTVSVGLAIPVFSGFSRQYAVKQARAEADAALARAASVKQQVQFQVFSSYYALQTAARRVNTADDLLESAQSSEDAALGRYRAGVGLFVDLLTAQSALASARAQQVQARWVWQSALAQLAHDTGVLDTGGNANIRVTPDTTREAPPQ